MTLPGDSRDASGGPLSMLEEIVVLDALTLSHHTEEAGDTFDLDQHRARVAHSLGLSELCVVRRHGQLVAYALLHHQSGGCWFVSGFNTHPAHRTAGVILELLSGFVARAQRLGITELRSNVYKSNRLSMAFHHKLGFRVTRENGKGVEFTAMLSEMARQPSVARTLQKLSSGSNLGDR